MDDRLNRTLAIRPAAPASRFSDGTPGISTLKSAPVRSVRMSLEKNVDCPSCKETIPFYRSASMTLHLGEKTKWRCTECGYGFVEINGIDSITA